MKWTGDWFVLAVLTAIIWGTVPFFEKRGAAALTPTAAVFVRCLAASVGMLVAWIVSLVWIARRPDAPSIFQTLRAAGWVPVLYMMAGGLIGSVLGQFTNLAALRTGEISRLAPITASWPILTFAIGVAAFGEPLTWAKVAGLVLVVGGVVLMRVA